MLNPFPELLSLAFFAPTVLRTAAAAYLFSVAHRHWQNKEEVAAVYAGFLGKPLAVSLASLSLLVEVVVALMLILGFYVQYAALAGAVIALAAGITPHTICKPFGHMANWLFFALCFSLLATGAGAFAFDIPL